MHLYKSFCRRRDMRTGLIPQKQVNCITNQSCAEEFHGTHVHWKKWNQTGSYLYETFFIYCKIHVCAGVSERIRQLEEETPHALQIDIDTEKAQYIYAILILLSIYVCNLRWKIGTRFRSARFWNPAKSWIALSCPASRFACGFDNRWTEDFRSGLLARLETGLSFSSLVS